MAGKTLAIGRAVLALVAFIVLAPSAGGEVLDLSPSDFTRFPLPQELLDAGCRPKGGIATGPDGMLWLRIYCPDDTWRLGRLSMSGQLSSFPVDRDPFGRALTVAPDGGAWFGTYVGDEPGLARATASGTVTKIATRRMARELAASLDGRIWYQPAEGDSVGRVGTDGTHASWPISPFHVAGHDRPFTCLATRITAAPDGSAWYSEQCDNWPDIPVVQATFVSRISAEGVATRFPVDPPEFPSQDDWKTPGSIVPGPDGAIWFAINDNLSAWFTGLAGVGRITAEGGLTQHYLPAVRCRNRGANTNDSRLIDNLVVGSDGALWFSQGQAPVPAPETGIPDFCDYEPRLGRVTTAGEFTEYRVPREVGIPEHMVSGPDGALWLVAQSVIYRYMPPGLQVQVTASAPNGTGNPLTVPATTEVTAKVVVKNTSGAPAPPARLTLTEGEGALYALRGEAGDGTYGTVDGKRNVVYFDIGAFAPGEQKTFEVPIVVAPPLADENPVPVTVRAEFTTSAPGVFGETRTLEVVGAPITEVQAPSRFVDLLAKPVADMGLNPDGALGVAPSVIEAATSAIYPSDKGDWWDYELRKVKATWPKWDQMNFIWLEKAGFSRRSAYTVIYLRGLMSLAPTPACLVSPISLAAASAKYYGALQWAKWYGGTDTPFQAAFGDIAKGLGRGCGALYLLNVLEFHEKYTTPLINAMRDSLSRFALRFDQFELQVCNYLELDQAMTVPLPRLVETDIDFRLARGSYHPIIHDRLLAAVDIRDGQGGTIKIHRAIERLMQDGSQLCNIKQVGGDRRAKVVNIQVHSPILPVVTDAQGRKSGVDAVAGRIYDEIPGSVFVPGHPWTLSVPAIFGPFQVSWTTAFPYEFGIDVQGMVGGTVTSSQSYTGTATNGFAATQTIAVTIDGDKVLVNSSALARTSTALGDFDGDGKSDILWRAVSGAANGAMFVWRMNGAELVSGTYLDPISTEWVIQGTGDFNGDGRSDVLWRNMSATSPDAGKLYVWLMDGPKVISGTGYTSAQADFEWAVQGIGDFDADGKSDIVWRAVSGGARGAMFLWRMNGTTLQAGTYLDPISTEWQIQRIGDLTGDGKSDILWRNMAAGSADAGKLYLWVMNGTAVGAGTGYTNSQADFGWAVQGIGDLDGDGKNDIVWRATSGTSAGAMFLWLMDGATIKGATFLDPISTDWQVQGLADLSGDGKADVLWRNVNPNVPDAAKLYVWIMDGAKVAAGTGYTSAQADATWDVKNPR